MKTPGIEALNKLSKVTNVKKQLAMAKVSSALARKQSLEAQLSDLSSRLPVASEFSELAAREKWYIWRDQKMKQFQSELAKATADYLETVKSSGKVIAQAEVAEELKRIAILQRNAKVSDAASEATVQLHLLADNVGDKNV